MLQLLRLQLRLQVLPLRLQLRLQVLPLRLQLLRLRLVRLRPHWAVLQQAQPPPGEEQQQAPRR